MFTAVILVGALVFATTAVSTPAASPKIVPLEMSIGDQIKTKFNASWAPGSVDTTLCTVTTNYTPKTANDNPPTFMNDCQALGNYQEVNTGRWIIGTGGDGQWININSTGDCALIVKNASRCNIGNEDVHRLIQDAFDKAGVNTVQEWTGTFLCGRAEVQVDWWLTSKAHMASVGL